MADHDGPAAREPAVSGAQPSSPVEPAEPDHPAASAQPTCPAAEPGRRPVTRAAVAVLLAVTGFAIPVAASAARETAPTGMDTARLVDQVGALGTDGRGLAAEIDRLELERAALASAAPDRTALTAVTDRADALAVLAGTVPVAGPGTELTVTDPRGNIGADVFVDLLQELRDAGAEAIELSGVRLVAESYVVNRPGGGLTVDGHAVRAPYTVLAIGDPHTLAEAMRFPGGVLDTVATREGATARVSELGRLEIRAVR